MKKLLILGVLITLFIVVSPVLAATLTTDKADYAPWETVYISGSGFSPTATVSMTVTWPDTWINEILPPAIADTDGKIAVAYPLTNGQNGYGLEGTYTITATDSVTGEIVMITFTDAAPATVYVSYQVNGGTAGCSAPSFRYVNPGGNTIDEPLTTTSTKIANLKPGTGWSVTPDPLTGTNEQCIATSILSGTAGASGSETTIVFTYDHQYKIHFVVDPDGSGVIGTPSGDIWATYDTVFNIISSESAGYEFNGWTSTDSNIVITDVNSQSTTATASAAGTITANFILATPANTPPEITSDQISVTVDEGSLAENTGTWSDVNAGDTVILTASVGDITKNTDGTWDWSYQTTDGPAQSGLATLTANDGNGGVTTTSFSLTVDNVAPTPSITGAPTSSPEGTEISLAGSATDPSSVDTAAGLTLTWDVTKDGAAYDSGTGASFSFTPDDNADYIVTLTATDKDNDSDFIDASITVTNVAPTVLITGPTPGTIIAVNTPSQFSGEFTDPGTADTHTAAWTFISNSGSTPVTVNCNGGVNQGAGTVNTACTFDQAGIYSVKLTVTDDDGGFGEASTIGTDTAYVVVYDPNGGFVTGGGWIMSPAGAYRADSSMTGKANFGFVSKYKKGATVPEGETEFQFKAGNLNFHSSTYQWLVVAGTKAIYKGDGTVNGAGNYGFLLSAIDGSKGETDKFRIKIWDKNNADTLVYDNLLNAADDADPTTLLGGGSIVVHK